MSTTDCDRLDDFYDGLLDDAERAEFKQHLRHCQTCQDNLHDRMQLSMRMRSLPGFKPRKTRPRWLLVGAPALMAMAATFALWPRVDVVAQLGQEQSALPDDVRFSHPAFDHPPGGTRDVMLGARPELRRPAAHFANLAELTKRGDHHALGIAHLRDNALDQAAAELQQAGESPAVTNDLAVLALVRGDTATAVALIDRLVEQSPDLTVALWNRGLLLKSMQLDVAAADAFTKVAERNEPAWSELARARARQLKDGAEARRTRWQAASDAGKAMVLEGKPPSPEQVASHPGTVRYFLYRALCTAPSSERASALLETARLLDQAAGQVAKDQATGEPVPPPTVLQTLVSRVASSDFARRAPLAARFLALHQAGMNSRSPDYAALVKDARAAGQLDILLVLLTAPAAPMPDTDAAELGRLVASAADPWMTALVEEELAQRERQRGERALAERRLLRAWTESAGRGVDYRRTYLAHLLSNHYKELHLPLEAHQWARTELELARSTNEWAREGLALQDLAAAAWDQHAFGLSRAYLDEVLLTLSDRCGIVEFARLQRADLYLFELRPEAARAELSRLVRCKELPQFAMVETYADLVRFGPRADEIASTRALIKEHRERRDLPIGYGPLADTAEGRLLIDTQPEVAVPILERAIQTAEALPADDVNARKARNLSFATLLDHAGRGQRWDDAFRLLGRELRMEVPARCAVGVGQDLDRVTVVVRGADGKAQGSHSDRRPTVADAATLVPPSLLVALGSCEVVDVLARPPLQGSANLLPATMAWRYRAPRRTLPEVAGAAAAVTSGRLTIANVDLPASLRLPRLAPWSRAAGEGTLLQGSEATPAAALAAMAGATEILIHTHAIEDSMLSDVAMLVLSAGSDHRYALTAREVEHTPLRGHPVVLLSACNTAKGAPYRHDPWSLPNAFIAAGASAVLAAADAIPDVDSRAFFDDLRRRHRSGAALAVALRDAREAALKSDPESTLRSVVLFE